MLVTIAILDSLLDSDPESVLFMLYIIYSILGSFLNSRAVPEASAPHLLDQVRAAETGIAGLPIEGVPVPPSPCGRTLGETAATCGWAVAWGAYKNNHYHINYHHHYHHHGDRPFSSPRTTLRRYLGTTVRRAAFLAWSSAYGRWVDLREEAAAFHRSAVEKAAGEGGLFGHWGAAKGRFCESLCQGIEPLAATQRYALSLAQTAATAATLAASLGAAGIEHCLRVGAGAGAGENQNERENQNQDERGSTPRSETQTADL